MPQSHKNNEYEVEECWENQIYSSGRKGGKEVNKTVATESIFSSSQPGAKEDISVRPHQSSTNNSLTPVSSSVDQPCLSSENSAISCGGSTNSNGLLLSQEHSQQAGMWIPSRKGLFGRSQWSNKKGNKILCRESFLLPIGWSWATRWAVECANKDFPDGWYYAPDFLISTKNCSPSPKSHSLVRRRKWIRMRQKTSMIMIPDADKGVDNEEGERIETSNVEDQSTSTSIPRNHDVGIDVGIDGELDDDDGKEELSIYDCKEECSISYGPSTPDKFSYTTWVSTSFYGFMPTFVNLSEMVPGMPPQSNNAPQKKKKWPFFSLASLFYQSLSQPPPGQQYDVSCDIESNIEKLKILREAEQARAHRSFYILRGHLPKRLHHSLVKTKCKEQESDVCNNYSKIVRLTRRISDGDSSVKLVKCDNSLAQSYSDEIDAQGNTKETTSATVSHSCDGEYASSYNSDNDSNVQVCESNNVNNCGTDGIIGVENLVPHDNENNAENVNYNEQCDYGSDDGQVATDLDHEQPLQSQIMLLSKRKRMATKGSRRVLDSIYKFGVAPTLRRHFWTHWSGASDRMSANPSLFNKLYIAAAKVLEAGHHDGVNQMLAEILQDVARTAQKHPFFGDSSAELKYKTARKKESDLHVDGRERSTTSTDCGRTISEAISKNNINQTKLGGFIDDNSGAYRLAALQLCLSFYAKDDEVYDVTQEKNANVGSDNTDDASHGDMDINNKNNSINCSDVGDNINLGSSGTSVDICDKSTTNEENKINMDNNTNKKPRIPEYHQAFSYIVALLLLNMPAEEAFWTMVSILEDFLPQGYYTDFEVQTDLRVVTEMISKHLPALDAVFNKHQIDFSVFATGWLQGLLCAHFPFVSAARIFDIMFAEGTSSIFPRFIFAFLRSKEGLITKMDGSCTLGQYSNTWAKDAFDIEVIINLIVQDAKNRKFITVVEDRRFELRQCAAAAALDMGL